MSTKDQIIEELLKEIAYLRERVADLERRLNLNSQNSSKPPSSDGLRKPNPKSLREKGKNKTGGQPKHRGDTLYQTIHPDQIIVHKMDTCPNCQKDLKKMSIDKVIKRQVFDLTIPEVQVTEHQVEIKCCSRCNQQVSGEFPEGVNAPVQYGSRVKAFAIYLKNQHFMPEARLKGIFKDLFNLPIACATLSHFSLGLSSQLSDFLEVIGRQVYKAKIKHLDETGLRVEGKQKWLHVASTDRLTSYKLGIRKDVPDKMLGVVVHDHWKVYFSIKNAKHAVCNVHILRELMGVIEESKEAWAKKMHRLLRLGCRLKNEYPEGIPKEWIAFVNRHYFKIVREGISFHENLPSVKQKRNYGVQKRRVGHNLLLRLQHYSEETLRFLHDSKVPFTNNQAEQDLRMMKVKQKISGCFRSFSGAETFCRIRSFLSTARKQGWNILDSIIYGLNGEIPPLTAV